jgi:hypothetical protein
MNKKLLLTLAAASMLGIPAFAQDNQFTGDQRQAAQEDPGKYTINPDSVRLELVGVSDYLQKDYVQRREPGNPLEGILVTVEKISNIARKVWKLVEANRPVANVSSQYAVAYPAGITSSSQLSGWSRPRIYTYGFYAENLYGGIMINARYDVTFMYGGSYEGKGRYITAATVIPTVAEVAWGYTFTMDASVPDSTVVNVGTDQYPVAALQLKVAWKMATVLKESRGTSLYYMQGDGYYREIASPWRHGGAERPSLPSTFPVEFVPPSDPVLPDTAAAQSLLQVQWQ